MNRKFEGLISLEEAAELIGVSTQYLRAEIKRGKLVNEEDCIKIGKPWIVDKEKFLAKYKREER